MVSIIVPTYNREAYIEACINSILAQTYNDWELLIIDDGSDDSTIDICEKYCKSDENIHIFPCEHKGVSNSRNFGIKHSSGEFVFFIDSDDLIHPHLLEELMGAMEDEKLGAACCRLQTFNNEQDINNINTPDEYCKCITLDGEEFIADLFKRDGISGAIGGKLFRKSFIENLYFDTTLKKGEDTYFLYSYALKGGTLAIFDNGWYYYRRHDNNSATVLKNQFDCDDYLKANILMYESEKERGNAANMKALKWYIVDSTQQLFDLARKQNNKQEIKVLRKRMLNTLFSDKDGIATTKRKISFIIDAYCSPLHKLIKRIIGTNEATRVDTDNSEFIKGLVSIVTPVYNNELYLSETLDSILAQTYNKVQMILIDDGSTDSTRDIAESYKEKFLNRDYDYLFISAKHKNASAAINEGLPYVRGEYLIWPDSDDLLTPDSIEKRVSFLNENSDFSAVRSLPEYFETETRKPAKPRETITNNDNVHIFWDVLEGRSFVSCGCYMLKSEELFKLYPNRKIPEYDVGQNFQMLLPYMYHHNCATICEPLYRVRVHDGSHSVRKLGLFGQYRVIKDFEHLIDDVAKIAGITDKAELQRIEQWKKGRRSGFRWRILNNMNVGKTALKIYHKLRKK